MFINNYCLLYMCNITLPRGRGSRPDGARWYLCSFNIVIVFYFLALNCNCINYHDFFLLTDQATLQQLLDKLLDLQQNLLSQNTHTKHIQDSDHNEERMEDTNNKMTSEADSDEEISSDFIDSDEEDGAAVGVTKNRHINDVTQSGVAINKLNSSDSMEVDVDTVETHSSRRARKLKHKIKRQKKWRLENGKHGYERHILRVHEKFIPYRNEIITKWNDKLKLASGKLNSKVRYLSLHCRFTGLLTVY